jgi:hypothetical protein
MLNVYSKCRLNKFYWKGILCINLGVHFRTPQHSLSLSQPDFLCSSLNTAMLPLFKCTMYLLSHQSYPSPCKLLKRKISHWFIIISTSKPTTTHTTGFFHSNLFMSSPKYRFREWINCHKIAIRKQEGDVTEYRQRSLHGHWENICFRFFLCKMKVIRAFSLQEYCRDWVI